MVTCYYRHGDGSTDGPIQSINSGICADSGSEAGFFSCCFSWSTCLPNALCFDANNEPDYYTAQCTDPTLQDSACTKACNDQPTDLVIYNSTSSLWQCCGGSNCSDPSSETFEAPAPNVLLNATQAILLFIPTSTSTHLTTSTTSIASTEAATSTATFSPSTSTAAAVSKGSSLSVGAGVGIGVGATILVVVAVLVALLLFRRKKGKGGVTDHGQDRQHPELSSAPDNRAPEKTVAYPHELGYDYPAHELPVNGQERD